MSDTLPYKATLKSGGGYDVPWITVDGANAAELAANLDALLASGAVQKVVEAASLFQAAQAAGPLGPVAVPAAAPAPVQAAAPQQWQASPPQTQPQWSQPAQQAAPAVPQVRLHPEGKPCACGQVLIFKEITAKTGKQYQMWTCPSQQRKGDGHDSEFVN